MANKGKTVDELTVSLAVAGIRWAATEKTLADSSATATNETGTGSEEHAVNALDWVVGLSESGLEERTIDFVRGPTPLKAMALEKNEIGEVLNVVDVIDDEIEDTVPVGLDDDEKPRSLSTRTFDALAGWKKETALAAFAMIGDDEGESFEVEEDVAKKWVKDVELKFEKVKEKVALRVKKRAESVGKGEDAAKYLWCEQTEWREKVMQCLMDLLLIEAVELRKKLAALGVGSDVR